MLSLSLALILGCMAPQPVSASFGPALRVTVVVVSATGVGYPPRRMRGVQARLMARRAAEVTAVRNLAARIGLSPGSHLGSFRYVSFRNLPGGAVEVTVETMVNARFPNPSPVTPPDRSNAGTGLD